MRLILSASALSPTLPLLPSRALATTSSSTNSSSNCNRATVRCENRRIIFCSSSTSNCGAIGFSALRTEKQARSRRRCDCTAIYSPDHSGSSPEETDEQFVVVNFYRFVPIRDPESEVAKHLAFLKDLDVHGRIYLNEQGINAQYSGPSKDALSYVEWLREDGRFSDILVQVSPALNGHAFPKLKVQFKPLVQLEGGISTLPLLDPSIRATPLAPSEWKKKLRTVNASTGECVVLDVRNAGYEWDIGHFRGAKRPEVDCFRSTSFGSSQSKVVSNSDPLADVDKEKTEVLMYCTGGIRCDVYSTILRKKGFKNLYTLKGGVSHYLENEGPTGWVGNLFMFDSRLALPPSAYKPEAIAETHVQEQLLDEDKFAKCHICGSSVRELRHRNCANLDCNLLFLCCEDCIDSFRGCCSSSCTTASRLRPVLPGHQRYKKWHVYRDLEV
ncbi:rhodanese-like domain-containing protein 8, chloroplastic isoform X1 [Punica granatum]|uniref:Rhodanese-like domain-containing protein 8, chloroplastic isoform X1 n=1 Tax=Punica granatum TaxID=22663 RepID=A0A6P8EEY7_PUNGR|nr:rhodanese-like domain-containing protein 8, chloroplastic isoform X1 [Punica granatum]